MKMDYNTNHCITSSSSSKSPFLVENSPPLEAKKESSSSSCMEVGNRSSSEIVKICIMLSVYYQKILITVTWSNHNMEPKGPNNFVFLDNQDIQCLFWYINFTMYVHILFHYLKDVGSFLYFGNCLNAGKTACQVLMSGEIGSLQTHISYLILMTFNGVSW